MERLAFHVSTYSMSANYRVASRLRSRCLTMLVLRRQTNMVRVAFVETHLPIAIDETAMISSNSVLRLALRINAICQSSVLS